MNKKSVSFTKLFSFADSYDVILMLFGTVAGVFNGVSLPLLSVLLGNIIDAYGFTQQNKETLREVSHIALQVVYLGIASGAAAGIQMACWMVTGERQAARIRWLYLQNILRLDIAYFDVEMNTGEAVGRISGDTVLIQDAMGEKMGKFVQLTSSFIGGFVIAFLRGWQLTLIILSVIPLVVIAGAITAKVSSKVISQGQNAYAAAPSIVEETVGCIRTVASYNGEKTAVKRYNAVLEKVCKKGIREGVSMGIGMGLIMAIVFSVYGLAVWFGGKMVVDKGYTGGQVINIVNIVLFSSISLGQIAPCVAAFGAGKAAARKLFEIVKRKSEIDVYDMKGRRLHDVRGEIEFKNVCFSYPSRPNEEILIDLNLVVPSGTTAALVGQSGCGKSTLISLVQRFYDPKSGEVLIDGVSIKDFQLKWMRDQIGLVSQEPVLFSMTIRENIAYGRPGAGFDEIKAAAKLANAANFVESLPKGYDTLVGERGTQLSGGEKQRVAIARAILKDPKILLLDEATSALDAESEKEVQIALDKIMVNRTTMIAAHRLTTVRNADMIVVIERGQVVEKGTHSELLEHADAVYSRLVRLQEVMNLNKPEISSISFSNSKRRSLSRESSLSLRAPVESIEPSLPNQDPKIHLRRLASLNKPELPHLILGSLAACLSGAILPLYGVLMGHTITTFFEDPQNLRRHTKFWSLMFLAFATVSGSLFPFRSYFFSVAGSKLIKRIRSKCFENVVNMEIAWFDEPDHTSGSISARLSTDAAVIRSLVGDSLATMVQNIATAVAALIVSFTASWRLAFIILAILPLMAINSFVEVRSRKGFSADSKKAYLEASQVANDAIGSIRTVASFCGEEEAVEMFKAKCEEPRRAGIRIGVISGITFGLSNFCLLCFDAITFYAGARIVQSGHATFTDVFQIFFALVMSTDTASHLAFMTSDSSKTGSAVSSIFEIMDRKSKINPSSESGVTLEAMKGDIEIHRVRFSYPSRPSVKIFRDFSMFIQAGKTVALVGESGCGKSTVISLLQRFYDPDCGCITLDNVDIRTLNLRWWRKQMGLVGQEPVLLNDTVRANIAFGKEANATDLEIQNAAVLANAHSFISALQNGYETTVGERGEQLSGGQKQRVAIARAIVKDPKILLLDEATSALDAESERIVQHALRQIMVNRTTVVVAHRLATVVNADIIAVLKNGVLVEKGKHETLMEIAGGVYSSLVKLHTDKYS